MVRFLQRIFGLTCQHVNGDKPYEKAGTFLALVLAAGRVGSGRKVITPTRECVSTGAAGAQTRRSLGHHLLHWMILGPELSFIGQTKFLPMLFEFE